MDPIQEEKQALSQQEEFESRLFAENDYAVIACVPATKAGVNDRSGVPKQYFLVLTVHKNDTKDCKLHTVRVKNNGLDLVIQKSPKIAKLKWFEIADDKNSRNSVWDFKLYWKNGSNESFALSPNTLRSVNLFAFMIYNVSMYCCAHAISVKPLELVELEVHGREWLDKIFKDNLLFRRINQIQQDIFTPIYKRLALNIGGGGNPTTTANNESGGAPDGKKRRLSMRNDPLKDGGIMNQAHIRSMDVPLMSEEETQNIAHYMEICNVSIDNIHLLESKLMEKQRDIMRENINAFQLNEAKLDTLLDAIDSSIGSVETLQTSLNQYKRHINKMASGVNRIKKKNHSLAIQDQNNTKLTDKLTEITSQLKLHAKYEQTLKNPSFKPETEYKRSLKAVHILSEKLSLSFTDGLESMRAVKSQRDHFKTLNERFCGEATTFLNDLFAKNSRIMNEKDSNGLKLKPHTEIHAILYKYDELLNHIRPLHRDKFSNILASYEKAFSKLYVHEFKAYFASIKTRIYKETGDHVSPSRMADFPSVNLAQLSRTAADEVELSRSTASTIFSQGLGTPHAHRSATDHKLNNSSMRAMPAIHEDNTQDSSDGMTRVTKVYRQCLAAILPVIIVEQQFMEKYFFDDDMSDDVRSAQIERILLSMFGQLQNQLVHIIDKADSMNNFNTLQMLIISERTLHAYRDYNSFLSLLLSKLYAQLTLKWNAFVNQENNWIKSQKISIKQAGILLPIQKFPAFCNEMHREVTLGDEAAKEITNLPPSTTQNRSRREVGMLPTDEEEEEEEEEKEEEKEDRNPFAIGQQVFRESEQVANTIHKMTTDLMRWLEKAAQSDPKYTHVCLMENYHYFYSVFSKTESLRSVREHVLKAKKAYDKARRSYVKWCVRYECRALTEFWDDFEQKCINDIETVSVYISSQKVRAICGEFLDTEKKVRKFVSGMFNRLKKHLGENDILFKKIWKKIAEYFCSKYKKFKQNVDKIYQQNLAIDNSKRILKYSTEWIWNQFVDQYRNAFQTDLLDADGTASSLGSTSMDQASLVSGKTNTSRYSSAYTASTKVKVQANIKDKQNKAKKGLSTLRRKGKHMLNRTND